MDPGLRGTGTHVTDDVGPAKRAVGVRPQPGVNTGDVKRVATLGKKTKRFVFSKLVQANRAVGPFD